MLTTTLRRPVQPSAPAGLLEVACLLTLAIEEGRHLMPRAGHVRVELREWELNGWFRRVAVFFDGFCRVLSGHAAIPAHEAETIAATPLNAHGQTLGDWGLRRWRGGWELDNLELDYQLRARPEALLQALEAFSRELLAPLIARWQALLGQAPAARAWSLAG